MGKIMENPIKMDDLGVPLFLESTLVECRACQFLPNSSSGDFIFFTQAETLKVEKKEC